MRTKIEIAADPTTPGNVLLELATEYPREIALNPNSPLEALLLYSTLDAALILVEQNPIWPLLRLEDPIRYEKEWKMLDGFWVSKASDRSLSRAIQSGFIAAFVEHVAHLVSDVERGLLEEIIVLLRAHSRAETYGSAYEEQMKGLNARWHALGNAETSWQREIDAAILSAAFSPLTFAASNQVRQGVAIAASSYVDPGAAPEASSREHLWQANYLRALCANDPVLRRELRVG